MLDLTTRPWQGSPRSFFGAETFQGQEGVRQHDHADVLMPADPVPPLMVIESQLVFELKIVLLNLPP